MSFLDPAEAEHVAAVIVRNHLDRLLGPDADRVSARILKQARLDVTSTVDEVLDFEQLVSRRVEDLVAVLRTKLFEESGVQFHDTVVS